jgi:hypothetical protein
VLDLGRIRKVVLATGVVSTVAGNGTFSTYIDSATPSLAQINGTTGWVVNDGTNLYWTDVCGSSFPTALRQMVLATGAVSTLSTTPSGAPFGPLTVGPSGLVYVAMGTSIQRVDTTTGALTPVVTLPNPAAGSWTKILGLAADATSVWAVVAGGCVAGQTSGCTAIYQVNVTAGTASQLAGTQSSVGPLGLVAGPIVSAGSYLYVSAGPLLLRVAKVDGAIAQVAGTGNGGFQDGTGSDAWFGSVTGLDTDGSALLVVDSANCRLRKVVAGTAQGKSQPAAWTTTMSVTPAIGATFAGSGFAAWADGTGAAASFSAPSGLSVAGSSAYSTECGRWTWAPARSAACSGTEQRPRVSTRRVRRRLACLATVSGG